MAFPINQSTVRYKHIIKPTKTVNGEPTTTTSDPVTVKLENPKPVGLSESMLNAKKEWEDDDDSMRENIALHIDATNTLLKVGLLVNGVVSGVLTRTFFYKEAEPEPVVVIPDFCTVAEGEVCAFFEAPSSWGNTICCWAWCDSPSENFTYSQRKDWPGVDCEYLGTAPNGNKVWKWTWDGTKQKNSSATQPAKIIFNNTGQPQTENLVFTQAGYYTKDGLFDVVTATAIHSLSTPNALRSTDWYDLQGRRLSGKPTIKGIYIKDGKKVVIR